jgi:hypothetical protein
LGTQIHWVPLGWQVPERMRNPVHGRPSQTSPQLPPSWAKVLPAAAGRAAAANATKSREVPNASNALARRILEPHIGTQTHIRKRVARIAHLARDREVSAV